MLLVLVTGELPIPPEFLATSGWAYLWSKEGRVGRKQMRLSFLLLFLLSHLQHPALPGGVKVGGAGRCSRAGSSPPVGAHNILLSCLESGIQTVRPELMKLRTSLLPVTPVLFPTLSSAATGQYICSPRASQHTGSSIH